MICYVLAMGKQHVGPHVVVGYGIKIFWPGLFITSPDHLVNFVAFVQLYASKTPDVGNQCNRILKKICENYFKNLPFNQCEQKHIMSTNSVTTKPIPALSTHLQFAFIT